MRKIVLYQFTCLWKRKEHKDLNECEGMSLCFQNEQYTQNQRKYDKEMKLVWILNYGANNDVNTNYKFMGWATVGK